KLIFPHRDPVASADSVVNVEGTIYSWRTDHVYAGDEFAEWLDVDVRVRKWDDVMRWIDEGTIPAGSHAHILYADFVSDPMPAIGRLYADLGLPVDPRAFQRMREFLEERNRGSLGNSSRYAKSEREDPRVRAEREKYRRYQSRFVVPDER
ncbi:MAG: sulfotransferase, partial [Gammaproteobacteria bacterium]